MNRHPVRDFIVGIFVLVGLCAVGYLSINVGGLSYDGPGGLTVYAAFDELGGLKPRAPVVVSGVKIGSVKSITLDPKTYRARVEMELNEAIAVPADSSVSIVTSGLLGDRYLSMQIGGDEQMLANGDEITFTESAILIERLLGKFVYGGQEEEL